MTAGESDPCFGIGEVATQPGVSTRTRYRRIATDLHVEVPDRERPSAR